MDDSTRLLYELYSPAQVAVLLSAAEILKIPIEQLLNYGNLTSSQARTSSAEEIPIPLSSGNDLNSDWGSWDYLPEADTSQAFADFLDLEPEMNMNDCELSYVHTCPGQSTTTYETRTLPIDAPDTNKPMPAALPTRVRKGKRKAFSKYGDGVGLPKRGPFLDLRAREETSKTRQLKACIRCKMQKIRCVMDPEDPTGVCLSCRSLSSFRLPCLRLRIQDSILFRTGSTLPRLKRFPLVGPGAGELRMVTDWDFSKTRTVRVTQKLGPTLELNLSPFAFPVDVEENEREMFAQLWGIQDLDATAESATSYINETISCYCVHHLGNTSDVTRGIFVMAGKVAPKSILVHQALFLWAAARCLEGTFRLCAPDTLGIPISDDGTSALTAVIGHQLAAVFVKRILTPLRSSILTRLSRMIQENKKRNWFEIFLTSYIILNHFELLMGQQRRFAVAVGAKTRYTNMPLFRGVQSASKALLAHFHYAGKGSVPLSMDWSSADDPQIAHMDTEHRLFMKNLTEKMRGHENNAQADEYDREFWFTGQLFDDSWAPRDTPEHSPPAGECS